MVNAEKRLVSDVLHLESLEAVIGISMGGMQAFDWAVRYPGFARRIIPIVGSPKLSPYDELLWRTELDIIERALAGQCDQATRAHIMGVVGAVHELALSTPTHVNATLTRDGFDSWLAEKEASYAAGWDPYDWAAQLRAMLAQDLTAGDAGDNLPDAVAKRRDDQRSARSHRRHCDKERHRRRPDRQRHRHLYSERQGRHDHLGGADGDD
jgi:homoserine O-acetyltransferase